jgi:hypothetical protein
MVAPVADLLAEDELDVLVAAERAHHEELWPPRDESALPVYTGATACKGC